MSQPVRYRVDGGLSSIRMQPERRDRGTMTEGMAPSFADPFPEYRAGGAAIQPLRLSRFDSHSVSTHTAFRLTQGVSTHTRCFDSHKVQRHMIQISTPPQRSAMPATTDGWRGIALLAAVLLLVIGWMPRTVSAQDVSPLQRLEQALGLGNKSEAQSQDTQQQDQDKQQQETLPPPLLQGPQRTIDPVVDPNRARAMEPAASPDDVAGLRPYLGIRTTDLSDAMARDLQVPVRGGAVIQEVVPDSPADKAGLEPGVVIITVDGRRVDRSADLEMQVQRKKPGDEIMLLYYQGAKLSRAQFLVGGIEERAVGLPASDLPGNDVAQHIPTPNNGDPLGAPQQSPRADRGAGSEASRSTPPRRGRLLRRLINPDGDGPLRILDRLPLGDDNEDDLADEDDSAGQRPGDRITANRNDFDATEMPEPIGNGAVPTSAEAFDSTQLLEMLTQQQQQIADLQRRVMELERRLAEAEARRHR